MFKNPFSFEGRIRRTEYAITYIIYLASIIGMSLLTITFSADYSANLIILLYAPLLWFQWAQGAKRCHERGHSGWFQLIPFYVFWILFAESAVGENEYGPNPKSIGEFPQLEQLGEELQDEHSS